MEPAEAVCSSSYSSAGIFFPCHQRQLRGILKHVPHPVIPNNHPAPQSSTRTVHLSLSSPETLHPWDFPSVPVVLQALSTLEDGPASECDYEIERVRQESDILEVLKERIFLPIETALKMPNDVAVNQRKWYFRPMEAVSNFSPDPSTLPPRPANKSFISRCTADRCVIDSLVGILAIIEVKSLKCLSGMPRSKEELISQYNAHANNLRPDEEGMWWMRAIAQLHGYLIDQECSYGILTCYNRSWFFKLDGENLFVSEGIPCDYQDAANSGITMMAILFAFLYTSLHDTNTRVTPNRQRRLSDEHFQQSPVSSSSSDNNGDDNNSDYDPSQDKEAPPKRRKTVERSPSAAVLSMLELRPSECLGIARDRIVLKGFFENAPVAMKMYDKWKDADDERNPNQLIDTRCSSEEQEHSTGRLGRELATYSVLEKLQGSLIPRLISRVSSGGNLRGFCMEWLEPVHWEEDGIKEKALTALTILVTRENFLHDDLSRNNFAIRESERAEKDIVLIDFELGHFSNDEGERKRYLKHAKSKIMSF